ncbi:hypothetical protein GW17_00044675 [Ensete ventricosum]|nr:hypothetical protein GW17_00044675 [Ensete ventricosum]RZR88353.1 hypothetical protein BHM03_00015914 [Ensete ventricosum]
MPATGAIAPAGGRAGLGRQPLAGALQSVPFAGIVPQPTVPAGAAPAGCCPRERRRPPLRIAAPVSGAGLPCGLAMAAAWPWVAGPTWGLVMVGCPSSSLLSLQKHSKNA